MGTVIECRSPQQIADDELLGALEMCDEALREWIPGCGYLYTGQRRERIKALKTQLETLILSGEGWKRNAPIGLHAHYVIHR